MTFKPIQNTSAYRRFPDDRSQRLYRALQVASRVPMALDAHKPLQGATGLPEICVVLTSL